MYIILLEILLKICLSSNTAYLGFKSMINYRLKDLKKL